MRSKESTNICKSTESYGLMYGWNLMVLNQDDDFLAQSSPPKINFIKKRLGPSSGEAPSFLMTLIFSGEICAKKSPSSYATQKYVLPCED